MSIMAFREYELTVCQLYVFSGGQTGTFISKRTEEKKHETKTRGKEGGQKIII